MFPTLGDCAQTQVHITISETGDARVQVTLDSGEFHRLSRRDSVSQHKRQLSWFTNARFDASSDGNVGENEDKSSGDDVIGDGNENDDSEKEEEEEEEGDED